MSGLSSAGTAQAEAAAGDERLERRQSRSRGKAVDFYTAVPAGHGDGKGLPVCIVLHGASRRPEDFADLGFGRALTRVVEKGAPPFVLAGADGGRRGWRPHEGDDPQRMAYEEIPNWCAERGFDISRLAVWGWSMGGAGALRLAQTFRGFVRATAAFSPAIAPGDDVFEGVGRLRNHPLGLWCGLDDRLLENVRAFQLALPLPPIAGGYDEGGHNMSYWRSEIPDAFRFIGSMLTRPKAPTPKAT
ncbi:alpha/beta hydrolase-fold protein [Asanoa sp. WMMD1127]|uniref:alpha/beta hydrolase n=1 Tax=Asanoa sp. WMMD1127 TaxID=3016107 RepID=UPI0024159F63|nr:alpha/beta hydrolase-fold protein [Asanoa sp. WMMD1127]MDG4822720.1 alpha/beta hydrolase-fold protein [Asanoa sp. WMMD1127]